jgi:hypothetical protein
MSAMTNAEEKETKPSKYQVIRYGSPSNPTIRIRELSFILDHWNVFTESLEDPILNETMSTAMVGSAYTRSSSSLTLRQLFGIWHKGEGIHSGFYDKNGEIIPEPLYMVGVGGSVLSGAFVFWGVVPSRGLIVISNRTPDSGKCRIPTNIVRYNNAAKEL